MELISEHNEIQVAYAAAVQALGQCEAADVRANRVGRITVNNNEGVIYVVPSVVKFVCLTPIPAPKTQVVLTWEIPTTREGGGSLSLDEIAGYEISVGDTVIYIAGAATIVKIIEDVLPGTSFKIRTVDTNGVEGAWSEIVQ